MKKKLLLCLTLAGFSSAFAQIPLIDEWMLNTDGATSSYWENSNGSPTTPSYVYHTTTDSANVTRICYSNDSVWIKSQGMTNDMGKFLNPGSPSAQNYTFSFPKNPQSQSGNKTDVPYVFSTGVLINGIPIFGLSNSKSWNKTANQNANNGHGYWNCEAWYGEGFVLDSTLGAHPQADGAYHSHAIPKRLYTFPSAAHSPIVGFAFDGYPVYGPYGYTTAMNATGGVSRMTSSYSLRSISSRTTLPDGTVLATQYEGPVVSVTHPLGEYIEDYQYVASSGTLDYYNGRYCVTPEYPSGTYAYFVTVDAAGDPAFPFYFGLQYYGVVASGNLNPNSTISVPSTGVTACLGGSVTTNVNSAAASKVVGKKFTISPNPSNGQFIFQLNTDHKSSPSKVKIYNDLGELIHETNIPSITTVVTLGDDRKAGLYYVHLMNENGVTEEVQKIVVQ
jgi:hypothetical protein